MKLYPDDWPNRLTTGLITAACIVAAWLLGLGPEAGLWPFMLSIVVAIIVGNLLGGLVYRLLFRPSSGGPPDHPPRA
jgi:branched-subunit amino acid ABC-type transport system permease component